MILTYDSFPVNMFLENAKRKYVAVELSIK